MSAAAWSEAGKKPRKPDHALALSGFQISLQPGYPRQHDWLHQQIIRDGSRAFEQLVGAKWEIQSQYAKKAFEAYVAQASKIGEMYVDLARSAYQPVEQAVAKTARKVA